ncbi:hypothetical protein Afil01_51790 [Actinorhabdospora filicis]|uniref:Uncharacterized protein n=1 Tax=Actinorhabdospora filicis TaxID=1785913 RepID=A0A9W6SR71_9ACTN|nr:hypothetical protein [Actinorhabdospora filicis]GLZ80372.1 hypothetical protein Afil01_51790 [Actinorhabdospora filicis]
MPSVHPRSPGSTMLTVAGCLSVLTAVPAFIALAGVWGSVPVADSPILQVLFAAHLLVNLLPPVAGIVTIALARSLNRVRYLILAITLTAASLLATVIPTPMASGLPPAGCASLIVSVIALALTGRLTERAAPAVGPYGGEFTVPAVAPPAISGPAHAPEPTAAPRPGASRVGMGAVPGPLDPAAPIRLRPASPPSPRDRA